MPNIKSAKKRVLVSKQKQERNKAAKSEMRTSLKKALAENADAAAVKLAVIKLDKAASIRLIHKNKVARLKSKITKRVAL